MSKFSLFFLLVFSLVPPKTVEANSVNYDSINYTIQYYYQQGNEELEKEIINGTNDNFFSKSIADQKFESKILWLKIDLNNTTNIQNWVLNFNESINYITVFFDNKEKNAGNYIRYGEKDIQSTQNVVGFNFKNSNSLRIYVKLDNDINVGLPNLDIRPLINWQIDYGKLQASRKTKFGIYTGINGLVCFVLIIVFFYTRDRTYLYFSGYLIFDLLYIMGVFQYYWFIIGDLYKVFWEIESIFLALFYICYFQFVRHYFNLKQKLPKWDKVFIGIIIQFLLLLILRIYFKEFEIIRPIMIIAIALLTIIFFIKLLIDRDPTMKLLFWGSMVFIMGLIVPMVLYILEVPGIDYMLLAMSGMVLQIIFFSFALASRMQLMVDEKNKARVIYIDELKRNEEIQIRKKQRLEQIVNSRTEEILDQQKELQEKTIELSEINEEVKSINSNLEKEIDGRTQKVRDLNRKLIDYSFRNAHLVRGPLARILGLIYLIKIEKNKRETPLEYYNKLSESAMELNISYKTVGRLLEDEEIFKKE